MPDQHLPHLFIDGFITSTNFQSPLNVQREPAPQRPRAAHGGRLLAQLQRLVKQEERLGTERIAAHLPTQLGMTVAIEISPKGTLDPKTFEWKKEGIEVLAFTERENSDVVALHVPEGMLSALERRIQGYIEHEHPKSKKPLNANLVNAIENIRQAAFNELWTDTEAPPSPNEISWCQLWLRQTAATAEATYVQFVEHAKRIGIEVEPGFVRFPGRVVVAVQASRETLEKAFRLLDMVAEIRRVEPTAEFFLEDLKPFEQAEWVANLSSRTELLDADSSVFVTLFDTGVNRGHPLLNAALDASDMHTVHPDWAADDHHGHGTEMAGLSLYGNLVPLLASSVAVTVPHRLESVKILPRDGQNPPHLYGAVSMEATARVEISQPERRRTFAMMTTSIGNHQGEPSEWSASLDQLAFGRPPLEIGSEIEDEDDKRVQRLFVLSAGNIPWERWNEYPTVNTLETIENPAQAWNVISVGASTNLIDINAKIYPGYEPIAEAGALAPSSRTSLLWSRPWPFKPDVVAEGGNGSLQHGRHVSVGPESLRLLTTCKDVTRRLLTESGDTSGAAAEVARLCAHLSARYPDYWPETIRGLVVHGARHTQAMVDGPMGGKSRQFKENVLKSFGYGLVEQVNSEFSTFHRPTLVVERAFNPYRKQGSQVKLGQMQLHDLPWPKDELLSLGEAEVAMRITLSYFVEPNPSKRGWQSKFRYQSFALRFVVKAATESDEMFMRRVNKLERDAESNETYSDPDSDRWALGAKLRTRGSIHSDVWSGTAAQLATKSQIAVIPVGGWWKDWKEAAQYDAYARYSLIVSLEVSEAIDADIYTPILTAIQTPVAISVPGS